MTNDKWGTCPLGGLWCTCTEQKPAFFGCCTSNPCQDDTKLCPHSDLRPAGMGTGPGPDKLPSNVNDGSYYEYASCTNGQWWTCALQKPSFQGCCEVDPCGGDGTGCPDGKLHPAVFRSIPPDDDVSSESVSVVAGTVTSVSQPFHATSTSTSTSDNLPETEKTLITSLQSTVSPITSKSTVPASVPPLETSVTTSLTIITSKVLDGTTIVSTAIIPTVYVTTIPSSPQVLPVEHSNSNLLIGAIVGGAGVIILVVSGAIWWVCRKRKQRRSATTAISAYQQTSQHPDITLLVSSLEDSSRAKSVNRASYRAIPVEEISSTSPAPPPYQSPASTWTEWSPGSNPHEMDSSEPRNSNAGIRSIFRGSHGEDGIAELPYSPVSPTS